MREGNNEPPYVIVVHGEFINLNITPRIRQVFLFLLLIQLHWREELVNLQLPDIVLAEWDNIQDPIRVCYIRDKVFEDVLQVAFKEHLLPAAPIAGDITDCPTLSAAPLPVAFIADQVGCHREGKACGDPVQHSLFVLRQEMVQNRFLCGE